MNLTLEVQKLYRTGATEWPHLRVSKTVFRDFLLRLLPPGAAAEDVVVRDGAGLYLLCALLRGDPGAMEILERDFFPQIRAALLRIDVPLHLADEVLQKARSQMEGSRGIPGYHGYGNLLDWLWIVSIRLAGRCHQRVSRELALPAVAPIEQCLDPEEDLASLRRFRPSEFHAALHTALKAMTSRERNLLRYHLEEGLSTEEIGRLFGMSAASASRWLVEVRVELGNKVRVALASVIETARIPMPPEEQETIIE